MIDCRVPGAADESAPKYVVSRPIDCPPRNASPYGAYRGDSLRTAQAQAESGSTKERESLVLATYDQNIEDEIKNQEGGNELERFFRRMQDLMLLDQPSAEPERLIRDYFRKRALLRKYGRSPMTKHILYTQSLEPPNHLGRIPEHRPIVEPDDNITSRLFFDYLREHSDNGLAEIVKKEIAARLPRGTRHRSLADADGL